jgi:hypothetical protein
MVSMSALNRQYLDDLIARLNQSLTSALVGNRYGDIEVVGASADSVVLHEAEGDPASARIEITVVLHMVEMQPEWAVDDVLTIRREIRHLSEDVELPSSVRFVPDEPTEYADEDEPIPV